MKIIATRPSILCVTQLTAFMPVYIEKKWRFGRVLPMPHTLTDRQTTEYRATQLVLSIKFKLSHAIWQKMNGRYQVLQLPLMLEHESKR